MSGAQAPTVPTIAEMRVIWDGKAAFWDDRMADGNRFHLSAVVPAAESLLGEVTGQRVLDIGCGNGVFTRRLAELGATVVATDFSPVFLERAAARSSGRPDADRITWRQLDATDPVALDALTSVPFDAVVSTMVLQDIPEIGPVAAAMPRLLRPGGRFVAVIPRPCFNTVDTVRYEEQRETGGVMTVERGVKTSRYLTSISALGGGMPGEPHPHHYFERTITDYLAPFLAAGMVLDGLTELPFRTDGTPDGPPDGDLPVTLAFRLRAP
ncbi:MAG TPA: class I SAM-dependent methyltransferase [Thermomicrobiales bacterium]|nr:class I SAM-dependent methyltransferase [Thermomicrobiales bacterium]